MDLDGCSTCFLSAPLALINLFEPLLILPKLRSALKRVLPIILLNLIIPSESSFCSHSVPCLPFSTMLHLFVCTGGCFFFDLWYFCRLTGKCSLINFRPTDQGVDLSKKGLFDFPATSITYTIGQGEISSFLHDP